MGVCVEEWNGKRGITERQRIRRLERVESTRNIQTRDHQLSSTLEGPCRESQASARSDSAAKQKSLGPQLQKVSPRMFHKTQLKTKKVTCFAKRYPGKRLNLQCTVRFDQLFCGRIPLHFTNPLTLDDGPPCRGLGGATNPRAVSASIPLLGPLCKREHTVLGSGTVVLRDRRAPRSRMIKNVSTAQEHGLMRRCASPQKQVLGPRSVSQTCDQTAPWVHFIWLSTWNAFCKKESGREVLRGGRAGDRFVREKWEGGRG